MKTNKVCLPKEHIILVQSLVDEGWSGLWSQANGGPVTLECVEGSLSNYIDSHGPLEYFHALQLALNLGTQIVALAKHGKGLVSLNSDDITVCGGGFVISNLSGMVALEGDVLHVVRPIDKTRNAAPELSLVNELPSQLHVSATYYSIATICIESMGIGEDMREIYGSKLYYLLERCMRRDPHRREFLYI